ncbi:MAG: 50S ribosomal protein L25 [Elusimicrobiota bacterium]|nr:50S ribosomal protein L25 [Endomicrobiia bacterium]MDW8165915.1 50S ribosomal protein L25 [Elusimicrobiota bacterium]
MTEELEIIAEKREISTKSKLKEFRAKGYIPAVSYGYKHPNMNLWVRYKNIVELMKKGSIEGAVFNLKVDNKSYHVIIKEIQKDPLTDKPIHIDFQIISLKEKIEVKVPIHLVGEETALKLTGGMIDFPLREVRIKCLPKDIPKYIEVDVSNLKIGQSIMVKDIPQEKFTILEPPETIVVHILSKKIEEVVPSAETSGAAIQEPEVISKGKKVETDTETSTTKK